MTSWSRPKSINERLVHNQRQIFDGDIHGRIRTRPTEYFSITDEEQADTGSGPDIYFYNQKFTVTSLGPKTLNLTYVPITGSEHVYWCPADGGGLYLEEGPDWQKISPASLVVGGSNLAIGDTLAVEYAYTDDDPFVTPISPSLIGYTVPGAWNSTAKTLSYDLPVNTVEGSLMVLTTRGNVAPGGGELVLGVSCGDTRMSLAHQGTAINGPQQIVESVWVGRASSSNTPVIASVTQNPSYNGAATGVLATFSGVNGYGTISSSDSGTITPVVSGTAAVAATWARGSSFTVVNAVNPTGYTFIASTGYSYSSTGLSWWSNQTAETSPTGTYVGEGCCIITMV